LHSNCLNAKGVINMKERHFEIIVEGLRSDFKAIAEGVTLLDKKIDNFEKRLILKIDEVRSQLNSYLNDRSFGTYTINQD